MRSTRASVAFSMLALLTSGGCGGTASPAHELGCHADAPCGTRVCRAAVHSAKDLAALPLVCGDAAKAGREGAACEQARDCARGICLLAGACARPCGDDADCAAVERCAPVYARTSDQALETLSACVARVNLPQDARVEPNAKQPSLTAGDNTVVLGSAQPDGETLFVLEHDDEHWPEDGTCRPPLCVHELRTGDSAGLTLFSADADYAAGPAPLNPVAVGPQLNVPVIMLPSGSQSPLAAPGYEVRVEATRAGPLRVTRLSRSAAGTRLDLNVFYLGALDWQPEGDRGPALLAAALDRVDEIFAQADIFIGEVRQIAVPGRLGLRGNAFPDGDSAQGFEVIRVRYGVYIELPGLFRLSAGAQNSAIDLFFVRDIEPLSADAEPEAEAGGIPGPLGMHGTASSGIAIATDMMAGDAEMLGRTLAHEIAHYLGLFHTSEADGRVLEALDDTPECRRERDTAGDGLGVDDCVDHGADNLMFWAKTSGTLLSEQQRAVLRSALVLQ